MPLIKVNYIKGKLVCQDEKEKIPENIKMNVFDWNSLYRIDYISNGDFIVREKVGDTPDWKENGEYALYHDSIDKIEFIPNENSVDIGELSNWLLNSNESL